MTERASKPSESGAGALPRLETVEFEPGMLDDLSPEDIERLKRGERLAPRGPAPAAGGAANAITVTATDGTPIAPPDHAAAYEGPRDLPSRTAHDTFEMQTVAVAVAAAPDANPKPDPSHDQTPESDARKAPTQRKLKSPAVEKDTIPDLVRREPTLRGLHAGAPGADEAPPSTGFTAVVVPPVEAPVDDTTLVDPIATPLPQSWGAGRVGLILAAAALAIVIVLVALRSRAPETEAAAPDVTASTGGPAAAASVKAPPLPEVTATAQPSPSTTPEPPAAKPKAKPVAPHAAPAPAPSGKAAPPPPVPDEPLYP